MYHQSEEEDYTHLSERDEVRGNLENRTYYWLLANDKNSGRPVILGPYNEESDANKVGFEKVDGNFEVIPLNTRDPGRATKILKYKRFHQTSKLEEALKRAKHQTKEPERA